MVFGPIWNFYDRTLINTLNWQQPCWHSYSSHPYVVIVTSTLLTILTWIIVGMVLRMRKGLITWWILFDSLFQSWTIAFKAKPQVIDGPTRFFSSSVTEAPKMKWLIPAPVSNTSSFFKEQIYSYKNYSTCTQRPRKTPPSHAATFIYILIALSSLGAV